MTAHAERSARDGWTPGPWVVTYDSREDHLILMGDAIGADGTLNGHCESHHFLQYSHDLDPEDDAEQFAEAEANVYLMAAAPLLVEALAEIKACLDHLYTDHSAPIPRLAPELRKFSGPLSIIDRVTVAALQAARVPDEREVSGV